MAAATLLPLKPFVYFDNVAFTHFSHRLHLLYSSYQSDIEINSCKIRQYCVFVFVNLYLCRCICVFIFVFLDNGGRGVCERGFEPQPRRERQRERGLNCQPTKLSNQNYQTIKLEKLSNHQTKTIKPSNQNYQPTKTRIWRRSVQHQNIIIIIIIIPASSLCSSPPPS